MKNLTELLIGTSNPGKIREFAEHLTALPLKLRNLSEFKNIVEIEETGATFVENAQLKARGYALQTGLPTIADDSGLEVPMLNNAPGVFSARFGGKELSDYQKSEKLLSELKKIKAQDRSARFVCVVAVAAENGEICFTASGVCNGQIAVNSSGTNGFGYDSIFIPDGFAETFGELPVLIKRKISHRAQANNKIMRFLQDFLQN